MLTKVWMEKASKGQMVKCGHIWQALYSLKYRKGMIPTMHLSSGEMPPASGLANPVGAPSAGKTKEPSGDRK